MASPSALTKRHRWLGCLFPPDHHGGDGQDTDPEECPEQEHSAGRRGHDRVHAGPLQCRQSESDAEKRPVGGKTDHLGGSGAPLVEEERGEAVVSGGELKAKRAWGRGRQSSDQATLRTNFFRMSSAILTQLITTKNNVSSRKHM